MTNIERVLDEIDALDPHVVFYDPDNEDEGIEAHDLKALRTAFLAQQAALKADRQRIAGELREIHLIGPCAGMKNGGHCFMCDYIKKLEAE